MKVMVSFTTMRFSTSVGWLIYSLGYYFGHLMGGVDDSTLKAAAMLPSATQVRARPSLWLSSPSVCVAVLHPEEISLARPARLRDRSEREREDAIHIHAPPCLHWLASIPFMNRWNISTGWGFG